MKMSLSELSAKMGVDPSANQLPTHSVGKDFGKGSKGKGFRNDGDQEGLNDWRSGGKGRDDDDRGGGKGMRGRRDDGPSRADEGDWFAKDRGDDRGGGGGGK